MNKAPSQASSQREMIRKALICGRKLTALDALREYGCMRLAPRIEELRKAGMAILTEWKETPTGKRVALYSLTYPPPPESLF